LHIPDAQRLPASGRHYPTVDASRLRATGQQCPTLVMLLCVSPPPRTPATIRVLAVPRSRNRVTDERLFRFA
ncbi:MAG: hypothetical protein RR831_10255, partial [Stenotrophomonas sp.]